jgi:predicted nucleic acid-binding protein
MKVVLDSSAALAAVIQPHAHAQVLAVLEQAAVVIAPDHFALELCSAIRKYAAARQLEPHAAARLAESALALVDRFVPTVDLALETLHESVTLGVPVGDIGYAILARREAAPVLTIDRRLEKLLAELRVGVVKLPKAKR